MFLDFLAIPIPLTFLSLVILYTSGPLALGVETTYRPLPRRITYTYYSFLFSVCTSFHQQLYIHAMQHVKICVICFIYSGVYTPMMSLLFAVLVICMVGLCLGSPDDSDSRYICMFTRYITVTVFPAILGQSFCF